VSLEPVYPRKLLLLGVALGLGLVMGIALALLLEYMDDKIRKPQDIAALGNLRVLGTFHPQRVETKKASIRVQ
jgi:capsular polysaccharide biosynthesis protein